MAEKMTIEEAAKWWRERATQRENEILRTEWERLQLGMLTTENARASGMSLCVQQGVSTTKKISRIVWVDRHGRRISPKWELSIEFDVPMAGVVFMSRCLEPRPAPSSRA